MKHILKLKLASIACILFIATASCTNTSVHIKGKAKPGENKIVLSQLDSVIAESNVDNKGLFNLEVKTLKNGYYKINDYLFYLAPGFNLEVDFNGATPNITGTGSKENNILAARMIEEPNYHPFTETIIDEYKKDLIPFKAFLKDIETKLDGSLNNKDLDTNFVASEKVRTNKLIDAIFSQYVLSHGIDYSSERPSDAYLMSRTEEDWKDPKTAIEFERLLAIDNKDCFPREFILKVKDSLLKDFDWNDEVLYSMKSLGSNLLYDEQIKHEANKLMHTGNDTPPEVRMRDIVLNKITSNTIKLDILTNITNQIIKVYPDYAEASYKLFLEQNPTEKQKASIEVTYKNFKSVVVGKPSAKFVNYKTPDDKTVSLNDFLGKYVYIDVWATWCGPCKKEIPYLKTLEEEFHGKNIEFVSISVDTEENKGKWKQMVKDMELKGIQIIADKDFSSDFIKAYNIAAIPRFILIDPNGNLVSSNELRPSDPELKEKLEKLVL